jgi:hypothetical protein
MSKKVRFYLILDLIGIGIALLIRFLLCRSFAVITELWIQGALCIAVNVICVAVCLFIVFFFLLYWWSDITWTNIKNKVKKKR